MGRAQQGRRVLSCLHKHSIFAEKRVNCLYFAKICAIPCFFGICAAVLRRRKPPACGGRPEGPGGFKSPPESTLHRPNHQGPRDHPAWHIGGAENKRPQRPHPPKGARPAHRPRRRPPSDDRPALGGRARRRRVREAAAPMAQRACRGPPLAGARPGSFPARRP